MVKYNHLRVGQSYALGDMKLGKYMRRSSRRGRHFVYFLNSQQGEVGENEIEVDIEDEFILLRKNKTGRPRLQAGKQLRKTRNSHL
uniref:Uncharacterized protein n=1 Tax=viral metagenome TaxID=1070528 RepID=A0A6C0I4K5_9ZZZZ